MELGTFEKEINSLEIMEIATRIIDEQIKSITRVCERYGSDEEDVRYYDVYYVKTISKQYVLKKTDRREVDIYNHYLSNHQFNVPHFYGSLVENDEYWICIGFIKGFDLREMTDELVVSAAESLSSIQTFYWKKKMEESIGDEVENRFNVYWKRILRRAEFVADNTVLREAYQLFLDRQLTCPCTISNGDFLEWNAIYDGSKVVIIDWGFGGIMPYSLDIARFIAHATENKCTFPFYMNKEQKEIFLNTMYKHLEGKITYEQFIYDIKLALLNEYVEFVEAGEDENKWYYSHAVDLARELLNM